MLELAAAVLSADARPVHYRMLADALMAADESLMAHYKRPYDSLYSLMTADIRKARSGQVRTSRFRFLGDGVFCAAEVVVGAESVVVHPKAKAEPKPPPPMPEPEGGRDCGNCMYMAYHGLQTVLMTIGSCANSSSGRDYVRPHEMCSRWARRSRRQEENDHKTSMESRAAIDSVNKAVRKGPMGGRDTR